MHVLLTGGAGDLGRLVAKQLTARGDEAVSFDLRTPQPLFGQSIIGSISDRSAITQAVQGMDCVVHIAAWHGIHEARGEKSVYDFWEVNVTGTFEVFEACARAGVRNVIFISSTSIDEPIGIYGHTKVLSEEIARVYALRHAMNVITLRPRAFIPHWNREVYQSFIEYARWFWGGAVHINDVTQGVMQSIDLCAAQTLPTPLTLTLDGAYEYTDDELANWQGIETFKQHYAPYLDLVIRAGLDPARKPAKKDISETQRWLGYQPTYSLGNLLEELATYGEAGAPAPW